MDKKIETKVERSWCSCSFYVFWNDLLQNWNLTMSEYFTMSYAVIDHGLQFRTSEKTLIPKPPFHKSHDNIEHTQASDHSCRTQTGSKSFISNINIALIIHVEHKHGSDHYLAFIINAVPISVNYLYLTYYLISESKIFIPFLQKWTYWKKTVAFI